MKCEDCNLQCCDNINYCPKQGNDLYEIKNDNIKIEILKAEVCDKCNYLQDIDNLYCSNCGNCVSKVYNKDSNKNIELSANKINIAQKIINNLDKNDLRDKLIVAISSIGILLLISCIVKLCISIVDSDMGSYISVFNIILGLNLTPVEVISSSMMGNSSMSLNIGMIIYIIAPIICISISTNIFMKKDKYENRDIIKDSILVGIFYSIILGIVSMFSKKVLNSNMDVYYSFSIIIKYNLFGVILNGFIISSIITYMNLCRYKKIDSRFKICSKALKIILLVYFFILVILITSLYTNNIFAYNKGIISIIGLTQLGVYILELITCLPLVIMNEIISIFNVSNISNYINESIKIFIYGAVLLNVVVLLIHGYFIKNKYSDKKTVKQFSLAYSILIGFIVHISKLNITIFEGEISIGGNLIVAIIISFLYCYSITSIGYKLNKE